MFRLNKLTDYGIVLMAHVARSPEDLPHTARSLSKASRIPLPTVGKLLRQLSERGLLSSHRGVKGGYNLARKPEAISVSDIVLALEGPIGFTECSVVAGLCNMERSCAIKINSQIIGDALRDALDQVMLADLNHEMAPHQRRSKSKSKFVSIESAGVTEGVR
ncbi:MAG: SUF system Fe-S cluster assembly regulator [Acidobacteriia bacterium]|jgi:FeS assembly SUF system regulator|nr:SUF system Fe-S cluster assembly regulator [Terriglobia bacterium]